MSQKGKTLFGYGMAAAGLALACGAFFLPGIISPALGISALVLPLISLPVHGWFRKKAGEEHRKAAEFLEDLYVRRKTARASSDESLKHLQRLRHLADLWAVICGLCGILLGMSAQNLPLSGLWPLVGGFYLFLGLSRIRLPEHFDFEGDQTFLPPAEYPELYRIAHKAADALGCTGEIKLSFAIHCNASSMKVGNVNAIQLGLEMVELLSEAELYNVLLHEFSHVQKDSDPRYCREIHFHNWMVALQSPTWLYALAEPFFSGFYQWYDRESAFYLDTVCLLNEMEADEAIPYAGNPRVGASAFLKCQYYTYYTWERSGQDETPFYAPEEYDPLVIQKLAADFWKALPERKAFWDHLNDVEILSRNASHPTTKMRLQALGIETPQLLPRERDGAYGMECEKIGWTVEQILRNRTESTYAQRRKQFYEEPLARIEQWKAQGMPLTLESYGDILEDLQALGQISQALSVCDRVLTEFSEGTAYANSVKGRILLCRYDDAGLSCLLAAARESSSYLDDLNLIGEYCCRTGNAEALAAYRSGAMEIRQQDLDLYTQMSGLSLRDRLSPANLSPALRAGLLQEAQAAGTLERLYALGKEALPATALVLEFRPDVTEAEAADTEQRLVRFLETVPGQYSLFRYPEVRGVEKIDGSCIYDSAMKG